MRYAILAARQHGSPVFEAVPQTGQPHVLNELFKKLIQEPGNIAELHLIVSDQGVTKRKKFPAPAQPLLASTASAAQKTPAPDTAPVESGAESPAPEVDGGAPLAEGESLAEADEPEPPKGKRK